MKVRIGRFSASLRKVTDTLRSTTTAFAVGWCMVVSGVGLVSVPAGLIVGGLAIAGCAVLLELGGDG